jgi:hypothetical protein
MTDKYKISGIDIYTAYCLIAREGMYNELLKAPKRKEGYSRSWPDEHGTERDLETAFYESRSLNLPFYLNATSESQFYAKYAALQTALLNANRFDFDVIDMNRRFKFYYMDMTAFNKLTIIKNGDDILCELNIQVMDDFPTENFVIDSSTPIEETVTYMTEGYVNDGYVI